MRTLLALVLLACSLVLTRATVYVEKASATQFHIYQSTGGTNTEDKWIKHRFYRYSTTPGAQWGWNGTKCGGVGTSSTYLGNGAGWTRYYAAASTPWVDNGAFSNADPNPKSLGGEKWDAGGGNATAGSDYIEHAIDANSTYVQLWVMQWVSVCGSIDVYWRRSSTNLAVSASDIVTSTLHQWLDNSTGRFGQSRDSAQYWPILLKVPSGASAVRIYPVGPADSTHRLYFGGLICFTDLALNPGDAGWNYAWSAILQTESTSDDCAISMKQNAGGTASFCTGPAHATYESNQVQTISVDGTDVFGTLGTGSVTSGTTVVITTTSSIKAPDTGVIVATLARALTFTGNTMNVAITWTKTVDHICATWYWCCWSGGIEAGNYSYASNSTCPLWCDTGSLLFWIGDWNGLASSALAPSRTTAPSLFGKRSARITYAFTNALASAPMAKVSSATRKLYCIANENDITSLGVGNAINYSYTITFDQVAQPSSLIANGRTIYIDRDLITTNRQGEIEAGEITSVLQGKIIKCSANTITAGENLLASTLTSSKDTSIGVGVARDATLVPESSPAKGDWYGVIANGTEARGNTLKYGLFGLKLTNNGTAYGNLCISNTTGIFASSGSAGNANMFSACTTNTNGATVCTYNLQYPFKAVNIAGRLVQAPQPAQ